MSENKVWKLNLEFFYKNGNVDILSKEFNMKSSLEERKKELIRVYTNVANLNRNPVVNVKEEVVYA